MGKVIGIGFHKTGTSSLEAALSKLGYKVCGAKTYLASSLLDGNMEEVWKITNKYNAFQDNPWAILYKELDERYPGSKFILTYRDDQQWLDSILNHFGGKDTEMRRWIYGVGHPYGNETTYLKRYQDHNKEVREYFKNRPSDFLEVCWEKGDGWKKLCTFLNCKIPATPFPHKNKRDRRKKKGKVNKLIKKIFAKI